MFKYGLEKRKEKNKNKQTKQVRKLKTATYYICKVKKSIAN